MSDLVARVRTCGSSFYWGIRLLPRPRREAMAALYLFCRAVDDIVDEPEPGGTAVRLAHLDAWRACLRDTTAPPPDAVIAAALHAAIRDFDLSLDPFMAIIDGMAMDLPPPIVAPTRSDLALYCARVAGAVGLISVRLFGATGRDADAFALATGEALQYTNILRDVAADADLGRVYLPRDVLEDHGINAAPDAPLSEFLSHPRLAAACATFATQAAQRHDVAVSILRTLSPADQRALRPALMMLALYRDLLDRLTCRGWQAGAITQAPPPAGKMRRLALVARYRVLGR